MQENQPRKSYRKRHLRAQKAGLPPGSLVFLGDPQPKEAKIIASVYDGEHFQEMEVTSVQEALALRSTAKYLWINVDGIHEPKVIEEIGKSFNIHPLALEDILTPDQRPRREEYDDFVLFILRSLTADLSAPSFESEQISLVLGSDYLISFQEKPGDVYEKVRNRLSHRSGTLRKRGPDYLLYTLIDTVVDNYFVIMENFGETLETLEQEIITSPGKEVLARLYHLKRLAIDFRRAVWPLREAVLGFQYGETKFIKKSSFPFFRDIYSHVIELMDSVEVFREMLSSLLDTYLSSLSNNMNSVIKVLTIITTICMPMSLVAAIYGMNFKHMPELEWKYGYPLALGAMLLIGTALIYQFKRRSWW